MANRGKREWKKAVKGVKADGSSICKLLLIYFFIIHSESFNCHCSAAVTLATDTIRQLVALSAQPSTLQYLQICVLMKKCPFLLLVHPNKSVSPLNRNQNTEKWHLHCPRALFDCHTHISNALRCWWSLKVTKGRVNMWLKWMLMLLCRIHSRQLFA